MASFLAIYPPLHKQWVTHFIHREKNIFRHPHAVHQNSRRQRMHNVAYLRRSEVLRQQRIYQGGTHIQRGLKQRVGHRGQQHINRAHHAAMLEDVRIVLRDRAITVTSGFRSVAVNELLGSHVTSGHCQGLAADFICPMFGSPRLVCEAIVESAIMFDQLIYEGSWIHISTVARGKKPRRQVLTAVFKTGAPTTYLNGLV